MPATKERINKLYKKGDINVDAAVNANESKEEGEKKNANQNKRRNEIKSSGNKYFSVVRIINIIIVHTYFWQ